MHDIIAQNNLRLAPDDYNPITGRRACGTRVAVSPSFLNDTILHIPQTMCDDDKYRLVTNDRQAFNSLRCRHDFEFWCASALTIKPKKEFTYRPFILNRPQRRVLAQLEQQRLANKPIRLIILKARQWGCSTLIQAYMAWIQMCLRTNWNSLICSHTKDSAVNIRRLYTRMIENYPDHLWAFDPDSDQKLTFKPFEGSANVREISPRGCRVAVSSAENYDAMRGYDFAMAHLSETAFWRDSDHHSPDDLIRSVCASVALMPLSLIVMESTANGIGNYFYDEWQRAKQGLSDKTPIFIPWYECQSNTLEIDGKLEEFIPTLTQQELKFWNAGATLQQINWYRHAARQTKNIRLHCAENPSDDIEAFATTDNGVFDADSLETLRRDCRPPLRQCCVAAAAIIPAPDGPLHIWQDPDPAADYVVAVDVGGRTHSADWSVIAVLRRGDSSTDFRHELVAQWRGHVDHDILVDIARHIARHYNEALLVIESNTLESGLEVSYGSGAYILNRLAMSYTNIYSRSTPDIPGAPLSPRIGFHTNRATKAMIIDGLIRAVREHEYIEHSADACAELAAYRQLPSGAYAAKRGSHDDILMTRAIALHVLADTPDPASIPPPSSINLPRW